MLGYRRSNKQPRSRVIECTANLESILGGETNFLLGPFWQGRRKHGRGRQVGEIVLSNAGTVLLTQMYENQSERGLARAANSYSRYGRGQVAKS